MRGFTVNEITCFLAIGIGTDLENIGIGFKDCKFINYLKKKYFYKSAIIPMWNHWDNPDECSNNRISQNIKGGRSSPSI